MNFRNPFARRESPLDAEVREIRNRIKEEAHLQRERYRIIPGLFMESLAENSVFDLIHKQPDSTDFIDIAFLLCGYPPELGALIASKFQDYDTRLRYKPIRYIIEAAGNINGILLPNEAQVMYIAKSYPVLNMLKGNHEYRAKKAGEFVSRTIFLSANGVKDARDNFIASASDQQILNFTLQEIKDLASPEMVDAILK